MFPPSHWVNVLNVKEAVYLGNMQSWHWYKVFGTCGYFTWLNVVLLNQYRMPLDVFGV